MTKQGMTIYRAEDATPLDKETMPPPVLDPAIRRELDLSPIAAGTSTDVLFRGDRDDGFSLVRVRFKTGYRLPRHSHDADCLYYIVSGSVIMGSHVLGAGDGFFVPADAPYAYEAGPDGVELLEFRTATTFDIDVRDQTVERWEPIVAAAVANHDRWVSEAASS
jgi:quercetin dioxygenase-like cupin family protein